MHISYISLIVGENMTKRMFVSIIFARLCSPYRIIRFIFPSQLIIFIILKINFVLKNKNISNIIFVFVNFS